MTEKERLQSILDLASARLRNPPLDANVEHDLKEIVRLAAPQRVIFTSPHDRFPWEAENGDGPFSPPDAAADVAARFCLKTGRLLTGAPVTRLVASTTAWYRRTHARATRATPRRRAALA